LKKAAFILILLLSITGWSQNQTNWWFFGSNAGIDFNSGAPVPNNVGQLDTIEGCSAISDACGALLFYTDGITVWDANHQIMPNGTGLLGNPSSTQSAIILPLPDDPDLYYVFSISINGTNGLYYSVVDMRLNGGTGDVITTQKNIQLIANSTEKLFAAAAANGRDAWVVSYAEQVAGSSRFDQFYAFKLTPSGIDLSATALSHIPRTQTTDKRGYLKVSPDGSKVAMMTQLYVDLNNFNEPGIGAWLLDFNNLTGRLTNPRRLNFPSGYQAYGTEFSLDSMLIYVDLNTLGSGVVPAERLLLQYNTSAPNFQNNPITIYQSDANDITDDITRGALQIAPDKKIYYTRDGQEWLSVINDPNSIGTLCNFQYDGLALTPGTTGNEGLPPFYNGFFSPSFSAIQGCSGESSQFVADAIATCPQNTVSWDFGDPASGTNNTSTQINPTHVYARAGTYTVNLIITTPTETYNASRTVVIVDTPMITPLNDAQVCDDATNDGVFPIQTDNIVAAALGLQDPLTYEATVHYNQLDAVNDFNAINNNDLVPSGTYFIRMDNRLSNGCFVTTSLNIEIAVLPSAGIVDDLIICDDFSNDGIEEFDLELAAIQGLGNQDPTIVDYSFYLSQNDADLDQNSISSPYNGTDGQEIFIRYENTTAATCYATTSFRLQLQYQPVIPVLNDIFICDDISRDLVEVFDLASIATEIQNAQREVVTTNFYRSLTDAELETNALPFDYSNTQIQETLWLRTENNVPITCFDIQALNIEVYPKPVVQTIERITKCAADEAVIHATPGFTSYLWNTGATTSSISVVDEGTYTVTATDSNGCQDTNSTVVANYAITQIIDIEVVQFTIRSNSISITAIGGNSLQYSIDGFIYQDSPVFRNLLPGYYTVYVRDVNGCDLVTAAATIIAAPPYFTPNQDGFHDYWQVIAIETEPDARIFIFDRFGKLLKQLSPLGPGWDGTYNGNPLPSSDYWYRVELIDGVTFKGHFSLKR
jgi:gliding motility-associated-like protein